MKIADEVKPRGWEALRIMLEQQGLSSVEIEEARDSFYEGMQVLSRLFLSQYQVERRDASLIDRGKHKESACM